MTLEMPDEQEPVSQPTQVADSAPKAEKLVKGMSKRDYMRLYMQKRRAKLKEQASVSPAG
jgi:hypothetical protein